MATDSCPKLAELEGVYIAIATGDTSMADGDAVRAALDHAESCPACSRELDAYRQLQARLRPPRLPDDAAARIAARVRETAHARIRAWERRRRLLRVAAAVSGIAAVALLAVALWPHKSAQGPAPVSASPAAPAQAPAPAPRPSRIVHQSAPAPAPITPEQQKLLAEAARLREVGRRRVRARQYEKAEEPLRQALGLLQGLLARSPDGDAASAALYEVYRCQQLLGHYLAREEAFRRYIALVREQEGREAAGRVLLADAHRLVRERDPDTAGRRLQEALALCPQGRVAFAAHVLMGLAAEKEQMFHLAYSQYVQALAFDPPPALAAKIYRNMVHANVRCGRIDAAIEDAEALCALPEHAIPLEDRVVHQCLLAHLHSRQGGEAASMRVLRQVIDRYGPDHTRYAQAQLRLVVAKTLDQEGHQ